MIETPRIVNVEPRILAAVRRDIPVETISREFKPALDKVWAFLKAHPEIAKPGGHNVFLYDHGAGEHMQVDFGVEVARKFEPTDGIICIETPAGRAVTALHRGSYAGLHESHVDVGDWMEENDLSFGSKSWEIYGDWTEDQSKLEVELVFLLD